MSEDQPQAEVPDVTSEDSSPQPADTAEVQEDSNESQADQTPEVDKGEGESEGEQKKNRVQERINKLTREKYEALDREKQLQTKLEDFETRLNSMQSSPVEPQIEDYDTDAAFKSAYKSYVLDSQQAEARQQTAYSQKQQTEQQAQQDAQERIGGFTKRAQSEAESYQGFWDAVQGEAFSAVANAMNPDVISLIQSSDKSTGLAYHLATNLDVADSIARMNPVHAARELVLIEQKLETLTQKSVSSAPPPPKPIGDGKKIDVPLEEIENIDDWMKRRNAKVRGN